MPQESWENRETNEAKSEAPGVSFGAWVFTSAKSGVLSISIYIYIYRERERVQITDPLLSMKALMVRVWGVGFWEGAGPLDPKPYMAAWIFRKPKGLVRA